MGDNAQDVFCMLRELIHKCIAFMQIWIANFVSYEKPAKKPNWLSGNQIGFCHNQIGFYEKTKMVFIRGVFVRYAQKAITFIQH